MPVRVIFRLQMEYISHTKNIVALRLIQIIKKKPKRMTEANKRHLRDSYSFRLNLLWKRRIISKIFCNLFFFIRSSSIPQPSVCLPSKPQINQDLISYVGFYLFVLQYSIELLFLFFSPTKRDCVEIFINFDFIPYKTTN